MSKIISGTKEWSVQSINILRGCRHRCRYCYARANALRFGRIDRPDAWGREYCELKEAEVRKPRRRIEGTIMFPSTHDITPEFLGPCLEVIGKILRAGNRLLIVSKPHLECVEAICREFGSYREDVLFRFTIGAMDDRILRYWEPQAPTFSERRACLRRACQRDFQTSVSVEPMLDSKRIVELFEDLEPYVSDTIWIGKMNRLEERVIPSTDWRETGRIKAGQTDERIRAIYKLLKDEPKVRWKESIKKVVGLELAKEAGLDR